jgi:hypothetical protein
MGSALAYEDERQVLTILKNKGYSGTFFNVQKEKLDVQGFLAENDEHQVLSFRGTNPTSIQDWLKNLKFWRREYMGVRAHAGFLDEWEAVRNRVRFTIKKEKPLLLTGHSKGAATATLAAYELSFAGYDVANVYTFGSPRCLDYAGARGYNTSLGLNTFRCFHSNDPVPRTPWAIRFNHVGQSTYIKESAGWIVDPAFWTLAWYQWTSYTGDAIEDHELEGYQRAIFHGHQN